MPGFARLIVVAINNAWASAGGIASCSVTRPTHELLVDHHATLTGFPAADDGLDGLATSLVFGGPKSRRRHPAQSPSPRGDWALELSWAAWALALFDPHAKGQCASRGGPKAMSMGGRVGRGGTRRQDQHPVSNAITKSS